MNDFKHLGVIIDSHSSLWQNVLLIETPCPVLWHFYKLKKVLISGQLRQILKIYIEPILQYAVLIYGAISRNVLKSLEKLSNCLVKTIFHKRKLYSIDSLWEGHKDYTFKELNTYELLKTLFSVLRIECKIETLSIFLTSREKKCF